MPSADTTIERERLRPPPPPPPPRQFQIHWTNADGIVTFEANEGEIPRTAALRRGVVSPHNGRSN